MEQIISEVNMNEEINQTNPIEPVLLETSLLGEECPLKLEAINADEQSPEEFNEADLKDEIEKDEIVDPIIESNLSSIANALKSDLKAQVEAVLFVTDTPVKTGAISKMLNALYDDVQAALVQLIQEYEDRNGGLEIGTDDGYIIQVKTQYLNVVTDMLPLELSAGPLRTLSAVALKEPVLQSEVVEMRGSSAYEHIHELVELDLVSKKPQGLSYILRTTTKFQQYFRLTQDATKIKQKLREETIKRVEEKKKKEDLEASVVEASTTQPD